MNPNYLNQINQENYMKRNDRMFAYQMSNMTSLQPVSEDPGQYHQFNQMESDLQQPQTQQYMSQNMPQYIQQTPQYIQQTPQYIQQTQQYMQQTPQYMPQTPQYMQQTPQYMQQIPQNMPQTPQYMPQTPQNMQPTPQNRPPHPHQLQFPPRHGIPSKSNTPPKIREEIVRVPAAKIDFVGYNTQGDKITDPNYYRKSPGYQNEFDYYREYKKLRNGDFGPSNQHQIDNQYTTYEKILPPMQPIRSAGKLNNKR